MVELANNWNLPKSVVFSSEEEAMTEDITQDEKIDALYSLLVNELNFPLDEVTEVTVGAMCGSDWGDRRKLPGVSNPCAFFVALIYLKRLQQKSKLETLGMRQSEALLVSMLVASKFLFDDCTDDEIWNSEWSESSGTELENLNKLERDFVAGLNWDLYVGADELEQTVAQLELLVGCSKRYDRVFCDYRQLRALWRQHVDALTAQCSLWHCSRSNVLAVVKTLSLCCMCYAAAVACVFTTATYLSMDNRTNGANGSRQALELAEPIGKRFGSQFSLQMCPTATRPLGVGLAANRCVLAAPSARSPSPAPAPLDSRA